MRTGNVVTWGKKIILIRLSGTGDEIRIPLTGLLRRCRIVGAYVKEITPGEWVPIVGPNDPNAVTNTSSKRKR